MLESVKSIFAAAKSNDLSTVQQLIEEINQDEKEFDVNRLVDETTQNTLMHIACSNGNLNACKYLFMTGMDLNEPNKMGHTPLFYAADCGNLSLVKWMVSNGADIDTDYTMKQCITLPPTDRCYDVAFTPLQAACVKGHIEIVDFLVECNADLSGCAINGVTPLHYACHQSRKDVAKVLLDAGADLHATDKMGVTPMDLASGHTQAYLSTYAEHGTFEVNDEDGIETGELNDSDDSASDESRKIAVPEAIAKTFTAATARQLGSSDWKVRIQGVADVALAMQQNHGQKSALTTTFDAACDVLILAAKDSVAQVFSSAMPLLKLTFNSVLPHAQFHSTPYHATHPKIGEVIDLLLLRAAGAHEREASEAVTSLLFLACKSEHATQRMTENIISQMLPKAKVNGWRQLLVYIRLLTAIASQYRFSNGSSLPFEDAIKISSQTLEHSNAKVRTAAIDLLVQAILITSEASGLEGTQDEIADQVLSFADSILQKYVGAIKPSLLVNINKGLKNALTTSKRLSESRTPKVKDTSAPNVSLLLLAAGDKKDELSDSDLPYAEPVQDQFKEAAKSIQQCFGEKVTRCILSNAWAPRVEGLSYLQKLLESKACTASDATVISAIDNILQAALNDRVNSVYEAGIGLLMEFLIKFGQTSEKQALQACVRPLISRIVLKLGDSKCRLQVVSEDALLFLSRQALVGPEIVLEEIPSCGSSASSTILLANKLNLITKLMVEFGVKEGNSGALPLKSLLQPAVVSCENKDASVRQSALQIFAEAFKVARQSTMPYLNGLARGARQKLISKLVDMGILESDLLMDEVDDFEVDATQTRPGTSGMRPPTASGSSTKHRPALTSVSLTTPNPTSSDTTLPYGAALTPEQESDYGRLITVLGENVVRCLLDKNWAQREAAVREIEKKVAASVKDPTATSALVADAATLMVLSEALELLLNDTVARVYQCSLRLLHVIATDFLPLVPGGDIVMRSTLHTVVDFVIQKLGDSKQRIRSDSFALLHTMAGLSHIGASIISSFLLEKYASLLTTSPVAIAEILMLLTSLLRESVKTSITLDVEGILAIVVPALENKHVDIRNAAVAAYTAIYEVTKGGSIGNVDVNGCLANLKPTVREAITRNIVQIQKSNPTQESNQEDATPEVESARNQQGVDMEKLEMFVGCDTCILLNSSHASKRKQGVSGVLSLLLDTKKAKDAKMKGAWEILCLLAKQLLVDTSASIVLGALRLLSLLIDTQSNSHFAVPWGEWGVNLILGSTIRSILQQASNAAVRVRHDVQALLRIVARRHTSGRNVVSNALLSAPEDRLQTSNATAREKRLLNIRTTWHLSLRLELLEEMIHENIQANRSSKDILCVENVVPFLGSSCVPHPSAHVHECTRTVLQLLQSHDATGLTKAIQSCSSILQRKLNIFLEDDARENQLEHSNSVVVRGSRASHVRRIAALRPPRSVPLDDHKSLGNIVAPTPNSARDNGSSFNNDIDIPMVAMGSTDAVPMWLSDRKHDKRDEYSMDDPSCIGASGLVKARRKSRASHNNNADDAQYTHRTSAY
ncbi:kinase [Thraustotheca clavata]|uniref:Kinase n=1 Tax=Thraustotheca clavata TaxID=74557 RepID=A0A1V9Y8P2_9STRA|nr:kinase [Thraustotheca clavata]